MYRLTVALACFVWLSIAAASADGPPRVRIELVDGSRIVGTLSRTSLQGRTGYGSLEIPFDSIYRYERLEDGQLKVSFANGDEITADPLFDSVRCNTLFGKVTLNLEYLKHVHVISRAIESMPAKDHLVAYYGFDSAEQEIVPNEVGDALHAKIVGAKWSNSGVSGGAIHFDGASRLEIPHDNRLCPQTFTFAAWVFPTSRSDNYQMLIAKTNASSWSGGYGVCRVSGDEKNVRFFINGYSSKYQSRPLPTGKWTHLACVAHGEGINFYMNGQHSPLECTTQRRQ